MKKVTIKEIKIFLKTLEENRYRKLVHADARRIAWFVNNSMSENYDDMPESMRKKWVKAEYKKERYMAKKFLESKKQNESVKLREEKLNELELKGKKYVKHYADVYNNPNRYSKVDVSKLNDNDPYDLAKKYGILNSKRDKKNGTYKFISKIPGKLKLKENTMENKVRQIIRETIKDLTEARKIKVNYSTDVPKIGDEVSLRVNRGGGSSYGTDGIVYDVKANGKAFRLKDEWNNKEDKWYYITDFKKAKVKRIKETIKDLTEAKVVQLKITKKEWSKTHKDYKTVIDGVHYVMKLTNKGTALVPVIVEGKLTESPKADRLRKKIEVVMGTLLKKLGIKSSVKNVSGSGGMSFFLDDSKESKKLKKELEKRIKDVRIINLDRKAGDESEYVVYARFI